MCQNVRGLVSIFQGLLELLCPSYSVFTPCTHHVQHRKTSIFTVSELFSHRFGNFAPVQVPKRHRFGKKAHDIVIIVFGLLL